MAKAPKKPSIFPIIHNGRFYNFHELGKCDQPISAFANVCMYVGALKNFMKMPANKHAWIEKNPRILEQSHAPVITWLGHATMLIQLEGVNILTDPIFDSPAFLYRRILPFGIAPDQLPPIHVVLISHNHRDHLDTKTIAYLQKQHAPLFLVPQGDKAWFIKKGCTNVREFTWWDVYTHQNIVFTFVPAWHWSRRGLFDSNRSLWGGWVIQSTTHTIYFAGDTAYKKQYFTAIKEQFPDIDVALMPIAPGKPDEFMRKSHVDAREAVQAFLDSGAKMFIPMHWGAFYFGHDHFEQPIHELKHWWRSSRGISASHTLCLVKIGQHVIVPDRNNS